MASRYLCPVFLAVAFWLPNAQAAVVPNVAGQTQAAATRTLANARLAVGSVTLQASPTVPAGQVISMSPAAGTGVADGAWVDLVVSTGPPAGSAPAPGPVRPPPSPLPPTTPPPPPTPAPGAIHISIKNEYVLDLNFGPLGSGHRAGTDEAEGVLQKFGDEYFGTVTAKVDSRQTLRGLMSVGNCEPPAPNHYVDSQDLDVVGRLVSGINPNVQTITHSATNYSPTAGIEYLELKFKPKTRTRQQRPVTTPWDEDDVVACHTLIDTDSGISFLPLNDARWTIPQGAYIILVPTEGVLNYTDNTEGGEGATFAPAFNVTKSLWTIRVERLQ